MDIINRIKTSSASTKIAISWSLWATITLTGYYFSRLYFESRREESTRIRAGVFNEFDARVLEARLELDQKGQDISHQGTIKEPKIWTNSAKTANHS